MILKIFKIMANSKVPAIILSLISFGAIKETFRILTSGDPDIAEDRTGLIIMSVTITTILIVLSIIFWVKKPSDNKRN